MRQRRLDLNAERGREFTAAVARLRVRRPSRRPDPTRGWDFRLEDAIRQRLYGERRNVERLAAVRDALASGRN